LLLYIISFSNAFANVLFLIFKSKNKMCGLDRMDLVIFALPVVKAKKTN